MKDRVAVVTGAASGIGKALAHAFAAEGANVVLADIEEGALNQATAEINEAIAAVNPSGGAGSSTATAVGVVTDVASSDSVAALADATIKQFGEVHILCNNAGVGGGGLIRNQQLVDWKWVVDVCLWGVIHGVHHFLPHLRAADQSHIMSTASVAGLMPTPGLGPYNAAKYGVVGLMETLYLETEYDETTNLGVSVLCPGVVRTNIATAQRNRPESLRRPDSASPDSASPASTDGKPTPEARSRNSRIAALIESGMDPADVAQKVIDAMYEKRFWVLSHPELLDDVNHRNQRLATLENPTVFRGFAAK